MNKICENCVFFGKHYFFKDGTFNICSVNRFHDNHPLYVFDDSDVLLFMNYFKRFANEISSTYSLSYGVTYNFNSAPEWCPYKMEFDLLK